MKGQGSGQAAFSTDFRRQATFEVVPAVKNLVKVADERLFHASRLPIGVVRHPVKNERALS